MSPKEFWLLTFAEFVIIFKEYARTEKRKVNELLFLAWHTALFERQKKLPSLKSIYITEEEREPQSTEEMIAMCRMFNAALGGKEIKT